MPNDDAKAPLLQAEIERLTNVLAEKGLEAREIRTVFDGMAEVVQSAEIRSAQLQASLTAAQSELTSCIERAIRAETKLENPLRETGAK